MGRRVVSEGVRYFASTFSEMQESRHLADYDPVAAFERSDVSSMVEAAEVAIEAFDLLADDERADVLALLMVGTRN